MTDHRDDSLDFDARLRTLLAVKAGEAEPALSGPELRRLAGERSPGVRRLAATVGAAAAVVVVALATQHLGESSAPQRGPAGHPPTPSSTSAPQRPVHGPTPDSTSRPGPTASPSSAGASAPRASRARASDTAPTPRSSSGTATVSTSAAARSTSGSPTP